MSNDQNRQLRDAVVKSVLEHLFVVFQRYGIQPFSDLTDYTDITSVIKHYGQSVGEVGDGLNALGLIERTGVHAGGYLARITVAGIQYIRPDFLPQEQEEILQHLTILGGRQRLRDLYNRDTYSPKVALTVARWVHGQGYINPIDYDEKREPLIELSEQGLHWAAANAPRWSRM